MEKDKKKYGLLKVIGIAFLFYAILTWIIPTGNYSGSEFVKGETAPVGLYGLFSQPIYSFAVFAQYILVFLAIGGLYGVLNNTSVYSKLVNKIVGKFENQKVRFLVISIVSFALFASLTGELMMSFVFVPFMITIILLLGYDKITALTSTVGATLVGTIASITGNMAIYKSYFKMDMMNTLVFNIIIFVVLVFLLIMFVNSKNKKQIIEIEKKEEKPKKDDKKDSKKEIKKDTKKNTKEEVVTKDIIKKETKEEPIPLYVPSKGNKKEGSLAPLIIILIIAFLFLTVGLYNWYYAFEIDIFTNFNEKLTTVKLFGTPIFSKILGNFSEIGYFNNYDLSAILLIISFIIGWIYSLKFSEIIDGLVNGAKKMLVPAIYVVLASTIFSCVVTSNAGNISTTISNFLLGLTKNYNVFTGALTAITNSFFYNDFIYLINGLYSFTSTYDANTIPVVAFIFQTMFGLMMLILPVSITLIAGLKYLKISYKDWVKYIWKFLVQILIIALIEGLIMLIII